MKQDRIVTDNRKARFDYFIEDKFEAGIELFGWEVKSCRAGTVNLQDSYVWFEAKGESIEAYLKGAYFSQYEFGDKKTQEVRRDRRLLLNRSEISKLHNSVKMKGFTCVATKIYFNAGGKVKVEVALARGKHNYDKKKVMKERDIERETLTTLNQK